MKKPEKKPTKSAQRKVVRSVETNAKVEVIQRAASDKELKPKEKAFIASYIANGLDGRNAAKAIRPYLTDAGADTLANRMKSRERVLNKISQYTDTLLENAYSLATGAESEQVRAKMTIDLLDRANIKEQTVKVSASVKLEDLLPD